MKHRIRVVLVVTLSISLIGFGSPEAASLPQSLNISSDCPPIELVGVSPFFDQDQTLYARADGYLWRSTDGDATWQAVHQMPETYLAYLLIFPVASETGLHLYLHLGGSSTTSYDGGDTWEEPYYDSTGNCWLATATNETGTLFASCYSAYDNWIGDGIHRSTDYGHSWQHVWTRSDSFQPASPSPNYVNDQTVFAIRIWSNPMLSTDGGVTWEDVSPGLCLEPFYPDDIPSIGEIIVSPNFPNDQTLLGKALGHLLKSEDEGMSWQHLYPKGEDPCHSPTDSIWKVRFSPDYASDHTIFIRTSSGFHVSYDDGLHWRQVLSGRQIGSPFIYIRRRPEPDYQLLYLPLLLQGDAFNEANIHQVFLPLLTGSGTLPRPTPLTIIAGGVGQTAFIRSDNGGVSWRCVNPPSLEAGGK